MLTLVTVIDALPALALEALLDGDDDGEALGDVECAAPDVRPVTITWCPTCSARFTEASAIRLMSFDAPAPLIVPAVRLLGSAALAPAAPELGLALAPPIFAFLRTKPPPAAAPAELLGAGLALLPLLSGCRQPVAVICPATSLDGAVVGWLLCGVGAGWLLGGVAGWLLGGVVGWLLGGFDGGGVCAASVPHSAMPLHSVAAHCQ